MGVPRTTDGVFLEDSEAPFSSDGMVTFDKSRSVTEWADYVRELVYKL